MHWMEYLLDQKLNGLMKVKNQPIILKISRK